MKKLTKVTLAAVLTLALAVGAAVSFTTVAMAEPGECVGITYDPSTKEFTGTFNKDGKITQKLIQLGDKLLEGLQVSEDGQTLIMKDFSFSPQIIHQDDELYKSDSKICPFTISDDITLKVQGNSRLSVQLTEPIDVENLTCVGLTCEGELILQVEGEGTLDITIPCPVTGKEFKACVGIDAEKIGGMTAGAVTVTLDGLSPEAKTDAVTFVKTASASQGADIDGAITLAIIPAGAEEPIEIGDLSLFTGLVVSEKENIEVVLDGWKSKLEAKGGTTDMEVVKFHAGLDEEIAQKIEGYEDIDIVWSDDHSDEWVFPPTKESIDSLFEGMWIK